MLRGAVGRVKPATPSVCSGCIVTRAPVARPVTASSPDTSTMPVSNVNCVLARLADSCATSAMRIVPRMPATAFGVLTSTESPARIRSLATATATLPLPTSMVAVVGVSLIVRTERSRTVTTALPPSRMRTMESSPVVMRSWTNTSSLNLSGRGSWVERATEAVP